MVTFNNWQITVCLHS